MSDINNVVGKNEIPAKEQADIQFDLAPGTGGPDTIIGIGGTNYNLAAIKAIIVARGGKFPSGALFTATDDVIGVEVDLKPIGGHGIHEGDESNLRSTATAADALYQNNGPWTDIDPMGGREDAVSINPTSFQNLFVADGSVVTLHIRFQAA